MFNFMKKTAERDDKEKRKREKKERKDVKKRDRSSMSAEELLRLDEVRRSLKIPGRRKEKEKLPSGITADYSASFFAHLNRDLLESSHNLSNTAISGISWNTRGTDGLTQSDSSEASLTSLTGTTTTTTTTTATNNSGKNLPPLPPKPPKRGILKGPRLSSSTSLLQTEDLPNGNDTNHQEAASNLLVRNTLQNEVIAYQNVPAHGLNFNDCNEEDSFSYQSTWRVTHSFSGPLTSHQSSNLHQQQDTKLLQVITSASPSADSLTDTTNSSFATPPFSLSPVGESQGFNRWRSSASFEEQGVELQLPEIVPLELPEPRELTIQRQPPPRNDFGFSLRRAVIVERSANGLTQMRPVIFAEPGTLVQHNNDTGLLPGDRLIEVNGINVDDKSREEIIDLIKSSANSVTVKVQPVAELSELSRRGGSDGRQVELAAANIRSGTLRRSGSLRFHQNTAKSEEHLAQEKEWLSSERVWLLHRGGFTPATRCGPADPESGKLRIRLIGTGEELLVDEEDVEKANPPQFDKAEELSQLRFLNESSVLHTLRQRYASNLIHTYAGDSMVVINPVAPLAIYSEKVAHMFRGCKSEDMPPHIYAMAQSAYRGMLATRRDHSLVFLGRSGSGKTTNFKHALHYLVLAAGTVNKILTIEKLNALFTVLEAFGNSRTHMNSNATRFTQLFSLDFDQSGLIASASLQVLLLEKSRIGRRTNGDPTFHAVYRLLAGAEGALRKELHLTNLVAENNPFVTPLQKHEDKQRAMVEFNRIVAALRILGVSETEEKVIWLVLAGIYHLSCAGAVKAGTSSQSRWQFARVECAEKAANLLGTTVEELSRIVFSQTSGGAGTPSTPRPALRTPSPTDQSKDVTGLDALEGLLVGLYSEMFHCVAALVNRSISSSVHTVSSLLLCDSPGFQNPASCGRQTGACFEDLCHNYLQERLQLLFYHTALVVPKDRYVQEGIDVDYEDDYDEDGIGSPQALISLMNRGSSQSATMLRTSQSDLSGSRQLERKGLLWILDEEAVCPGGSDESFLDRLFSMYGDRDHQLLLRKAPGNNQFVLQHLLGTNPVLYTATGWLKATRENPVSKSAISILQESMREDIGKLFVSARGAGVTGALCGAVSGLEGSQSLRRASSIRRTCTAVKRKNVCLQVKFTVDGLVETLRRTRVKFVHCMLPQHNAGCTENKSILSVKSNQSEDSVINVPLLRSQIRGSQIIDAIRLHKVGFPKHMALGEFRRRFSLLSSDANARPGSPVGDERRAVEDMLLTVDLDPASYRVGQSQIRRSKSSRRSSSASCITEQTADFSEARIRNMDAATILAAILGGFVLLILYFLLAHQNAKNYWKKRGIPQVPGSLPVVGNTLPLLTQTHNLITLMEELYNMNKDSSMVGYLHMFRPALLVRDPDLVKTVLQVEFQNFNENFLMLSPENDPLLCRNPFFSTGQFWIAGRKRLTYAFSSMRLKVLVESIRVVSHKLDAYIAKQLRGKDSLEVELKDLFARFTLEAVANAGFGMEGFSFDDEKHPGSLKEMAAKVLQPNTIDNIKFVLILSTPTLSKLLRLSFLSAEIDRYFRSLVKEIIRVRKEETVPRNDFFQLMSDLEKSEGEQIDIESMTAYCLSFLVDGYETSSTTLAYVGFVLAKYPDVQEKAREEVKSVLAKHKNTINYDCLKELTYMDQVISEAMRIYPTAGALTKMCTKETRLTGSDGLSCVIEKGTQVIIPVKGLHNDPKYWKDPEVFDPERFSKENAKDIRKFTYTPFGEGPRQCVGMRMAQMQMKAALTAVLDKYSLELSPRTRLPLKMDPQIGIIGNPLGGVWVYMKPLSA